MQESDQFIPGKGLFELGYAYGSEPLAQMNHIIVRPGFGGQHPEAS